MTEPQTALPHQATAKSKILLSAPDVGALEEEALIAALRSGWVAPAGPDLTAFEEEMAARIGVEHAVGLASGTAGLHLGLLALDVQPGDIVITSTLTFAATANAVMYADAVPYFVDVDPATGNMDPLLLDRALHELQRSGQRVGAIVPVDIFGKPAAYAAIETIAANYGVPVLADAAESVGATQHGEPAGSFGSAAVFSFNGNKIMTTSGGGMLVTRHKELADKVRYLSTQARQPVAHYEHTEVGFNYRLSNLLAALGRAQLMRLDSMIDRRREVRDHYRSWCAATPGAHILGGTEDEEDNCWLTPVIFDPQERPVDVEALTNALGAAGIEARRIWKPMHAQPVFSGARSLLNGSADELFDHGLLLPSGSTMTEQQIERVINALNDYFGGAR